MTLRDSHDSIMQFSIHRSQGMSWKFAIGSIRTMVCAQGRTRLWNGQIRIARLGTLDWLVALRSKWRAQFIEIAIVGSHVPASSCLVNEICMHGSWKPDRWPQSSTIKPHMTSRFHTECVHARRSDKSGELNLHACSWNSDRWLQSSTIRRWEEHGTTDSRLGRDRVSSFVFLVMWSAHHALYKYGHLYSRTNHMRPREKSVSETVRIAHW